MIEDLMQHLGNSGWDKFDNLDTLIRDQTKAIRADLRARSQDLAEVFSTPAGKRVLETLAREIVFAPHMLPLGASHTAEQQALYAAFRQGQKDVVASIVNAITAARGEEASVQKGET